MKRCVVTGAAGFIGSHLCERLLSDGHTVVGIDDLSNGKLSNLEAIKSNPNFHFIGCDISSPQAAEAIEGMNWVFHLAAKADIVPSIEAPMNYHNANVTGTISILEASRKAKVKRFVYAASSSCYGIPLTFPTTEEQPSRPEYPYALTKYLGEQYAQHWQRVYGLSTISLRLFNVYGPRARTNGTYGAVFGVFLSQISNGAPVTIVGDGQQSRDFTYVTDVVDAFVKAAESDKTGHFNVGSSHPQTINKLVELLGAKDIIHIRNRPGEPVKTWAYTSKARNDLGWEPKVSFEEGVSKMKELIPQYKDAPLWTPEKIEDATKNWFLYLGDKQ